MRKPRHKEFYAQHNITMKDWRKLERPDKFRFPEYAPILIKR